MSEDEQNILIKLYESVREDVKQLRADMSSMRRYFAWSAGILLTGFILPVSVSLVAIALELT